MQRWLTALLLLTLVTLTALSAEAAKPIIEITDDVPVYDNRTGQLVEVGYLVKGETFTIVEDYGKNWWKIRWDDYYGFVAKNRTAVVNAVTYRNATKRAPVQQQLTALQDSKVMDNQTEPGVLRPFAIIKQGQKYASIRKMGNWYGVEMNGRLGFIHASNVEVTTPAKPPVAKPTNKTGYTTAYTEVVDFRRDKPASVMYLYANTPIQYVDDPGDAHFNTHVKVKWGDAFVYVSRKAIKEQNVAPTRFTTRSPNGKFIIPYNSQRNHIYTNESGKLVAYAHLNTNQRFPLIRTEGKWYVTVIAGREGYIHESHAALDRGVPVLMYHHVLPERDLGFFKHKSTTVTSDQFAAEMAYLKSQNYETVTLTDFRRYLKREITLPANALVLTFDDGLLSTREYAYPVLKKYNFKAAQFLITARNDSANPAQVFSPTVLQTLSWQDVNRMGDVFSFEGHTHNLHNIIGSTSQVLMVSNNQLATDLQNNITRLPKGPRAFAYPFGQFNATTVQLVKNAGFDLAFTTREGYNSPYENPYYIKRVSSNQSVTLEQYKRMVRPY